MTETSAPQAERPLFPDGYGLPTTTEGMLTWADVEPRLESSISYWMATVRPDGRPHVVPRWGVWVAGRFYYDGASTTVHAQNLALNPHCSLNLENGTEAVIVEGESHPTTAPADGLGVRIAQAFTKYHDLGYKPGPGSWASQDSGLRVLVPKRALAWFKFPADATRFRFG